jgi:hypothetical protein
VLQRFTSSRFLRRYYAERSLERISHFTPATIAAQWLPLVKETNQELV